MGFDIPSPVRGSTVINSPRNPKSPLVLSDLAHTLNLKAKQLKSGRQMRRIQTKIAKVKPYLVKRTNLKSPRLPSLGSPIEVDL